MKFELDFFEDFLQGELKENRTAETVVADFEAKKNQIASEVERVKVCLRNQVFSQQSESHLERCIQQHQTCIIAIADEVLKLLDEEEAKDITAICPKHSWCNLVKIIYKSLDELLTYIEKYFSKFFDPQAKIPDCYAILSAKEIEEKLNAVLLKFSQAEVEYELVKIATAPLKTFIKDPIKASLSYQQLIYYKALTAGLVKSMENGDQDLTAFVTNQLLYLNFNTTQFLHYYTKRIIKQIEDDTSLTSQLEQLAYHRKLVSQVQIKPGFAFRPAPSFDVQKQILHWINEEIDYIETKRSLKLIMLPAEEAEKQTLKLSTSLSVPQLALFFRLLNENGILKVPNVAHLVKVLSNTFASLRDESMSANSIRNRYYEVDDSTRKSVSNILNKLIGKIQKMER